MGRLVAYIAGSMVAVLAVGTIFGERFADYTSVTGVLIFAAILGVLSAFVKPVLELLTLPISCLTFGLSVFLINVFMFGLAAYLTPDVTVSILGSVLGAIFVAVASGAIYSVVDEK